MQGSDAVWVVHVVLDFLLLFTGVCTGVVSCVFSRLLIPITLVFLRLILYCAMCDLRSHLTSMQDEQALKYAATLDCSGI